MSTVSASPKMTAPRTTAVIVIPQAPQIPYATRRPCAADGGQEPERGDEPITTSAYHEGWSVAARNDNVATTSQTIAPTSSHHFMATKYIELRTQRNASRTTVTQGQRNA